MQENLPIKILNLITSAKSFMPWKVAYPQVLGIKLWISLVAQYSTTEGFSSSCHSPIFQPVGREERRKREKKNSHNEKVACKPLPLTPPEPELTHVATDVPTRGSGNCSLQLGGHASGEKL